MLTFYILNNSYYMSCPVVTVARDVSEYGVNADESVWGVNSWDVYDGCRFACGV